ncbi:MAG: chemotaxis protein MotB [Paraglaciecola sp.]|jgi:chemotaxis protein MotB
MKKLPILLLIAAVTLMSSCVSQKKYQELEDSKNYFQDEYTNLKAVKDEKTKLETEKKYADVQLRQTMQELEQLTVQLERLKMENANFSARYNELLEQNKSILNASSTEKQTLEEQLGDQSSLLDQKQRELDALEYTLNQREQNVHNLQENLEARETRINELEASLNAKDAQMQQLRANINNALRGFTASDLTVTERNGKIYVSLSQDLLFSTGSDAINFKGKNAIQQLAGALQNTGDIGIMVEGHTDNAGSANYNWDLSVKRATSVVKQLVVGGVNPDRITAAGRAFYAPITPNDTAFNKAKNRRTEIILSPKLDGLYDLLKN